MFRYYKVPVYELQEDLVSYNQLDYLVVTPYHLFAKELLTGYYSIEILTKEMVDGSKLKLAPGNTLEIKKKGHASTADIKAFGAIESVLGRKRGHGAVLCMARTHLPVTGDVDALPVGYI